MRKLGFNLWGPLEIQGSSKGKAQKKLAVPHKVDMSAKDFLRKAA